MPKYFGVTGQPRITPWHFNHILSHRPLASAHTHTHPHKHISSLSLFLSFSLSLSLCSSYFSSDVTKHDTARTILTSHSQFNKDARSTAMIPFFAVFHFAFPTKDRIFIVIGVSRHTAHIGLNKNKLQSIKRPINGIAAAPTSAQKTPRKRLENS